MSTAVPLTAAPPTEGAKITIRDGQLIVPDGSMPAAASR